MSETVNPIFTLVDTTSPEKVYEEAGFLANEMSSGFDTAVLKKIFDDIRKLYDGEYAGYQACCMEYHDIKHTTDVFLAMSRIMHGSVIEGQAFQESDILLGLVSALMHDVGYIRKEGEKGGTGAQFTSVHVERGIEFGKSYFKKEGISQINPKEFENVMLCTKPGKEISTLSFNRPADDLIGKMLGTADLLGQMSDRMYLEKILLLFLEFREADIGDFNTERELLENTTDFYEDIVKRLENDLNSVVNYARIHFRERWKIDSNLYMDYLQKNIDYLQHILSAYGDNYRSYLRRGDIVDRLRKRGL